MQPDQRRADIVGFLTQIHPQERYALEEALAAVQKEAQEWDEKVRAVSGFLEERGVPGLLEARSLVEQGDVALREATAARRGIQVAIRDEMQAAAQGSQGETERLRQQLVEIQDSVARGEHALMGLRQEADRLTELLASLRMDRQKSQRLQVSATVLSSVDFGMCPRCLLEITPEMKQREQHARCSLCSRPLRTTSDTPPRSAPRTADIDEQIEETETVLVDVQRERDEVQRQVRELRTRQGELGARMDAEAQAFVSPSVDRLVAQTHEVAVREGELARAREVLRHAEALEEMRSALDNARWRQGNLQDALEATRRASQTRLRELQDIYCGILRDIEFPNVRTCAINAQTLMPWINGYLYTHGGTALKGLATTAYHLALLELARQVETFFPRMLVIDSPAAGDLNETNHEKLLRYLARLASDSEHLKEEKGEEPDWQIILTTRKMIPELEPYVVERVTSPGRMLLR